MSYSPASRPALAIPAAVATQLPVARRGAIAAASVAYDVPAEIAAAVAQPVRPGAAAVAPLAGAAGRAVVHFVFPASEPLEPAASAVVDPAVRVALSGSPFVAQGSAVFPALLGRAAVVRLAARLSVA